MRTRTRHPMLLANAAPAPGSGGDDVLQLTAPIDLIAAAPGETGADGKPKLPSFTINAYSGGVMSANFYLPVVVDLAGLRAAGDSIPILLEHDTKQPLGVAHKVKISASGVSLDGVITGGADDDASKRVMTHAKNGFKWQASIGAPVERRELLEAGKTATVNGRTVTGPLIIARQAVLREVSFVAVGADATTSVKIAASQTNHPSQERPMNFEQWLKANGFDAATITDAQRPTLEAAWKASQKKDEPKKDSPAPGSQTPAAGATAAGTADLTAAAVTDLRASIATETKRISAIQTLCAKHPDIATKAIEEGWSADKTELEVMRASRPKAPAGIVINPVEMTSDVLMAAACVAGKLEDVEKQFKPETLEAAHTRFRGRIGLQELLLEAAWAGGYQGFSFKQDPQAVLRAAFSTLSLPGVLSNSANKFLLEGYMHVEQTWRIIASVRPVSDFKEVSSYRLTTGGQFEEVGPDGELKHGQLSEEKFTNQAKTFGVIHGITRTDLLNDNLGAITSVPRKIGRDAALRLNTVFWTEFMANSDFFKTANKNIITGAGSALGSAGLTAAVIAFRKMVDAAGFPLGSTPTTLLVPPDLEVEADELFVSTNNNTGGAASTAKVPNRNVHAGKYKPAVSTYLSNTAITGNSTTAWYLLGDPADISTIEVCFLNGVESPTIETAEAEFSALGIQMRGFFDFNARKQDPKGGVKANGA